MKIKTEMKPTIYDTRSYVRMNVDMRQAMALSLVSLFLGWFAPRLSNSLLSNAAETLSAVTVYFAMMALPFRSQLLVLTVRSLLLLIAPTSIFSTLRIVLFGALLIPASHSALAIAPFFLLMILWGVTIAWHFGWLPLMSSVAMLSTGFPRTALLECGGLLISMVLLWSERIAQIMSRERRSVDARSMLMALSFLGTVACVLIVSRTFLELADLSLAEAASRATHHRGYVSLAVIASFCIPVLIGLAFGQILHDFLHQLKELSNPNKRVFKPSRGIPLLKEFKLSLQFLRSLLDNSLQNARESGIRVKDLNQQLELKERETKRREADAENLERLMSAAPLGYLAMTGGGAVIAVNKRFFDLTQTTGNNILGQHFTALEGDSTWRQEIVEVLQTAIESQRELATVERHRSFSSPCNGVYLEMELRVTKTRELALVETKTSEVLSPSHTAITLFIRPVPDLRQLQLRLLSASTLDMLGYQAFEIVRGLRKETQTLASSLLHAGPSIQRFIEDPRSQRDAEIALLLRDIEKFSQRFQDELDSFHQRSVEKTTTLESFELASLFRHGIEYLFELLAIERTPEVLVEDDDSDKRHERQLVRVKAAPSDFMQFFGACLAVIQSIIPRAQNVSLTLGYENVGAGTATIIPGSSPGEYARITIVHPGQSITSNMINAGVRSIAPQMDELGDTEAAFALLSLVLQRLNGFLSVQSSPTKGTTITMYIPEEPGLIERRPRDLERKENQARSATQDPLPGSPPPPTNEASVEARFSALLIGTSVTVVSELTRHFESLGFKISAEFPLGEENADQDTDLEDALTFGGAGFGSLGVTEVSRSDSDEGLRIHSDPKQFDLIVLEASRSQHDVQTMLSSILSTKGSESRTIVFGLEPPEDEDSERADVYLHLPVAREVVQRAIKKLFGTKTN